MRTSAITLFHNPACGTSRTALATIREAGHEPIIIDYLETPPDRETLRTLIADAGLTIAEAIREKEPVFSELGLGAAGVTDEQRLDAILAHPVLMARPFIVTPRGTRLCRPLERIHEVLPG